MIGGWKHSFLFEMIDAALTGIQNLLPIYRDGNGCPDTHRDDRQCFSFVLSFARAKERTLCLITTHSHFFQQMQ